MINNFDYDLWSAYSALWFISFNRLWIDDTIIALRLASRRSQV